MTLAEILSDIVTSIENDTQYLARPSELILTLDKLLEDELRPLDEVVNAISRDPVVTARLLQIVNSPYIKRGRHVMTIRDSINRLGLALVKDIVFCVMLRNTMETKDPKLKFALSSVWEHSVEISTTCLALAALAKLEPPTALVAGLLHDIGEIPIIMYYNANTAKELPPLDTALRKLGPIVGSALMLKWKFEYRVAQAVFHRDDTTGTLKEYAKLVDLSHAYLENGMPVLLKFFEPLDISEAEIIEALDQAVASKFI